MARTNLLILVLGFYNTVTCVKTCLEITTHHECYYYLPPQFGYHQVALSSHTLDQNNESYSHDHPYPLRQRFFVEPKSARGAIKCDVAVTTNSTEKLASVLVLPYSPTSKDTTPEPIRVANHSLPSSHPSTGPPSPISDIRPHFRPIASLDSNSSPATQSYYTNGGKERVTIV